MKIPVAPLQRIAFGVAFCSLAAVGASAIALITQPAASSAKPTSQQIEFVDPAADEAPVETAAPTAQPAGADRAEQAADRAETAAGRAEVAATHVDEVLATTTTTTVSRLTATPTTTPPAGPVLVGTIIPMEPTTTTTTVAKQWVEIARIPAQARIQPAGEPIQLHVTLRTGELRIGGPVLSGGGLFPQNRPGDVAVWLGTDAAPTQASPATAENPGTVMAWVSPSNRYEPWAGPWPTGDQTISVGQFWDNPAGGWMAPWWTGSDIVIEEYR